MEKFILLQPSQHSFHCFHICEEEAHVVLRMMSIVLQIYHTPIFNFIHLFIVI
jgi:hypothetical protein